MLAGALLCGPASASPPARVMSLNVCTDQLAMTLAAPGQLVSVSFLAREPGLSMLHEEAKNYGANRGLAEEVFLQKPDLVVTGTYSLHNTTALLRRLSFAVEEFSFVQTLDTIPDEVRRMGALLGQEDKARAIADGFAKELADIERRQCDRRPTAVAYEQNGVALGSETLADSVITAAGFDNLAADLGVVGMSPFPVEQIVARRPDVIITRDPAGAPTLGAEIPRHPAISALPDTRVGAFVPEGSWSCGAPAVMEAVRALVRLREEIAPCPEPGAPR
ncbi:periplasmic binding protein [Nitratireductor pacificus pht-3B]|uniref:Periplasmic binding protein n=2 Tax=Nitratireductor TaxID=245876 RepID=K2MF31_9HYPH|nr:periplasmic binding protein [Nitratireductor pacificus pht-3B]